MKRLIIGLTIVVLAFLLAVALPLGGTVAEAQAGTTVEVTSAELAPGGSTEVQIMVKDITDPTGLGGYLFIITFNPAVVNVDQVLGGEPPFDIAPIANIDNTAGIVRFCSYMGLIPGPTGNITVAHLALTAVGEAGDSTTLDLTIDELKNTNGNPIPAMDVDGMVRIAVFQPIMEKVNAIGDYIQDLPNGAFKNNAEQRKNAFHKKLVDVMALADESNYQEAINKLHHDIRAKADGSVSGNPKNDWITDAAAQEELCSMIDDLIAYLEGLLL